MSAFTCQNLTLRPWYATYSFLNVDVIASLGPHHDANTSTMWSMSASKSASPWTLAHSASDVIGVIDTLSSLGGMAAAAGGSESRESRGQEEQRRSATDAFAFSLFSLTMIATSREISCSGLFAKRHVRTRLRHEP